MKNIPRGQIERHRAALNLISDERARQETMKEEGRFTYTTADEGMSPHQKLSTIMEELGEVAREQLAIDGIVQEVPARDGLLKELTQVAALTCGWMESLL